MKKTNNNKIQQSTLEKLEKEGILISWEVSLVDHVPGVDVERGEDKLRCHSTMNT